ncbi:hypothetical protein FM104_06100 [Microbacterium esteraromaticum]|uniref:Uncharacterized protein n=1 Tax=Microbacterium esteraromaticum TaxID=57043 RepID=A0A1R4J9Z7_9MICO|nr:hypothetical protein FM104_06100 [Microbacterium esteraromaticum]
MGSRRACVRADLPASSVGGVWLGPWPTHGARLEDATAPLRIAIRMPRQRRSSAV